MRGSIGSWVPKKLYSHSCLQDLDLLGHLSPRGGRGSQGGPGWGAEGRRALARPPQGISTSLGCSPAPHLPGGPCLQVCQADPLHPAGRDRVSGGAAGRGTVVRGGPHLPGCLHHPSLHALPAAQVNRHQPRGEKHKSPVFPCSLSVPPPPQGHRAPQPPLAPHYLLATQPDQPRGAWSPRLTLLPWLPWVTLGRGKGTVGQGSVGGHGDCWGEKRLSTAPSTPWSSITAQPGRTAPPKPDGWTDRAGMSSAMTLPLDRSYP